MHQFYTPGSVLHEAMFLHITVVAYARAHWIWSFKLRAISYMMLNFS